MRISGLVVEYIVAIDVTRVRFPADALTFFFIDFTDIIIESNYYYAFFYSKY